MLRLGRGRDDERAAGLLVAAATPVLLGWYARFVGLVGCVLVPCVPPPWLSLVLSLQWGDSSAASLVLVVLLLVLLH